METLTIDNLAIIAKEAAPKVFGNIMIDNTAAPKRYDYCYIEAAVQRVEYNTEQRSAAVNKALEDQISAIASQMSSKEYVPIENDIIEEIKQAPKYSAEGFFASTKKKMNELMNGGRDVEHHKITLSLADGRLTDKQPTFAVTRECSIGDCPNCNGSGILERTDKDGNTTHDECSVCKGLGRIGTLTYFTPKILDRQVNLTVCLEGEIAGLPKDTIKKHTGDTTLMKRMLTHINGIDQECFDEEILPYLDIIHDRTGEPNAIEDIYYQIVPCFTFNYTEILTETNHKGILVDPFQKPELILPDSNNSMKNIMTDSVKNLGRFFGSIGRTAAYKDKKDLLRAARLMIATVVADGTVNEEEKLSLKQSIRSIDSLTSTEQESLAALLSASDGSFITDDDYHFHSSATAKETLDRIQDIAGSDGLVHETERNIIEKLRLEI